MRAVITGTGSYLPSRIVSNEELAQRCGSSAEWIVERTGIEQRHFAAEGETASVMGAIAARRALEAAERQPTDVDALIFATLSPDYLFPGCACLLQASLGMNELACFDLRNQCAGFVHALSMADAFVRAGMYRCILIVAAELQSTGLRFDEAGRELAVLFGDGAGAVLLEARPEHDRGIMDTRLGADGQFATELYCDGPASAHFPHRLSHEMLEQGIQYPRMNGRAVFRHAVARMKQSVLELLEANQVALSELHLLIPHQANARITEMLRRMLEAPEQKVYSNIQRVGNTTAASIPIALDECVRNGLLERGQLFSVVAFGAGFCWGSALIRY